MSTFKELSVNQRIEVMKLAVELLKMQETPDKEKMPQDALTIYKNLCNTLLVVGDPPEEEDK